MVRWKGRTRARRRGCQLLWRGVVAGRKVSQHCGRGLRVQVEHTHQPAKAASSPKSMPAFAGATSGLAANSCCAGERLATRLSTEPPRSRSAGRAAVSLDEQRWRGCADTGLRPAAGAWARARVYSAAEPALSARRARARSILSEIWRSDQQGGRNAEGGKTGLLFDGIVRNRFSD